MKKIILICLIFLYQFVNAGNPSKILQDGYIIPMENFPIMGYLGVPQYTEINQFHTFRDCRMNVFYSDYGSLTPLDWALDMAAQAGVKIIISCPELISNTEATVRRYMNNPGLAGYFIHDEPTINPVANKLTIDQVAERVNLIRSIDNQHYCYVNMYPSYATGKDLGISNSTSPVTVQQYQNYVNQFTQKINVSFLSFDHYPITNIGLRGDWFQNLQIIANKSKEIGKPFWAFVLSTSHSNGSINYPVPNINHIRLQAFANLAYGAQGIEYFSYGPISAPGFSNEAPLKLDLSVNPPIYNAMQLVNSEILTLSGIFKDGKVVRIRHTGSTPLGTVALDYLPDHISLLTTSGSSGAIISEIKNDNRIYIVIVNKDHLNTMRLNINVDSHVKSVDKWATIRNIPASNSIDVLPGDIKIFVYEINPMSGVYRVGTNETYPNFNSLSTAINTINNSELTGDVTLEITSNLSEIKPVSLNYIGTKKITIKPAPNIKPIVTFNSVTNGTGLLIKNTKHVIINGSNNNTSTRDMTFVMNNNLASKAIELYGNSDNVTIKNLNTYYNSGIPAINDRFGIILNESSSAIQPDNLILQNCKINSTTNQLSGGIKINGGSQNSTIEKNDFYTLGYPIQTVWAANINITENNIYSYSTGDNYSLFMFIIRASGVVNINRNTMNLMKINTLKGNPFLGILCTAGTGTYNISNNFIKTVPSAIGSMTTPASAFYGMHLEDNGTYNIFHNSIVIPSNNYATNQACIKTVSSASNPVLNIKNNIFANYSTNSTSKIYDLYNRTSLSSNFNDFIYSGSGGISASGQSLISWHSSTGQDINSVNQNVFFINIQNADLRLTSLNNSLEAPLLTSVPIDRFGVSRPLSTSMGAHQPPPNVQNINHLETKDESTKLNQEIKIKNTNDGIIVELSEESKIELYSIDGNLIESTKLIGTYLKSLRKGVYIIIINGKKIKFIKY